MINIFNESRDTQKKKIPQTGNHGSGQWKTHGEGTRHG
jgi:hypothetical protein